MPNQWDLTNENIENTYQRVLQTPDGVNIFDGTGSLFTVTAVAAPAGPNQSVQFNDAGATSGSGTFTFNKTTNAVTLTGSLLVTQSHISTVDYIDFTKLTVAPAYNEGRLHWLDDTKTLQIDTDKNDFMIEIGHQNVVRVYNDTGVDIGLGKIVRISGSQGNQPKIVTASYNDDQSSAATLGFAATLIAGSGGNRHGYVVTNGILRNVNTVGYAVGDQLYLSSSGNFTNVPPDAPLHEVRLGKVVVSNALGIIYVDIMNGYELTELHDVKTTTYNDGDLLVHSGSLWTNSKQLTGSYGLTGSLNATLGFTGSLFGTASWADSASQALTASFYRETDPIFVAKSASLATTGSNTFIGNQTISGSLIVTGSISSLNTTASQETFSSATYISGDIIQGTVIVGVNQYDLVYLNIDGTWQHVDQTSNTSTKMLGIYLGGDQILIDGNISATTAGVGGVGSLIGVNIVNPNQGLPVYIESGSAWDFSTTIPTSDYIRTLGYIYYNNTMNTDNWILKFRPSTDWYKI